MSVTVRVSLSDSESVYRSRDRGCQAVTVTVQSDSVLRARGVGPARRSIKIDIIN